MAPFEHVFKWFSVGTCGHCSVALPRRFRTVLHSSLCCYGPTISGDGPPSFVDKKTHTAWVREHYSDSLMIWAKKTWNPAIQKPLGPFLIKQKPFLFHGSFQFFLTTIYKCTKIRVRLQWVQTEFMFGPTKFNSVVQYHHNYRFWLVEPSFFMANYLVFLLIKPPFWQIIVPLFFVTTNHMGVFEHVEYPFIPLKWPHIQGKMNLLDYYNRQTRAFPWIVRQNPREQWSKPVSSLILVG